MKKPLFDKVILEKITEDKTKAGLILLTPDNQEDFYKGLVVAVGDSVTNVHPNYTVGTTKHSGIDWKEGDIWYRLVKEQDILFIIE